MRERGKEREIERGERVKEKESNTKGEEERRMSGKQRRRVREFVADECDIEGGGVDSGTGQKPRQVWVKG